MVVKISINAVERYLSLMMSVWFNHNDVESENLKDYMEGALEIGRHMKRWNDEKYMQLAFAHLIESKDMTPEEWEDLEGCTHYVFVEHEFKEIVEYAYSVLWSEMPPEKALKGYEIEFIKTGLSIRDWTSVRDELNPSFEHKS